MNLHKHGSAWCLNDFCAPTTKPILTEGERLLLKEIERYHPRGNMINLHYHGGPDPCTGRFCRKRGTPKVEERDAFVVLAAGRASYWSRYPILRCPRCKMHLGRRDHFDGGSSFVHQKAGHKKEVHWCCPDSCELQSIRQCKELDAAVVTTAVERRPFVPVTEQWELAQELAGRAVPFRVFYVKLGRLHPRIHGCYHTTRSFCSGRFHLNSQCQGGC